MIRTLFWMACVIAVGLTASLAEDAAASLGFQVNVTQILTETAA